MLDHIYELFLWSHSCFDVVQLANRILNLLGYQVSRRGRQKYFAVGRFKPFNLGVLIDGVYNISCVSLLGNEVVKHLEVYLHKGGTDSLLFVYDLFCLINIVYHWIGRGCNCICNLLGL